MQERHWQALTIYIALAVCSAARATQTVTVTEAWARATAPSQNTAAVYLSLTSPAGDRLVAVTCDAAASAMLHRSTSAGGMSGMTDMDGLTLPPGEIVRLQPRGMHVMLAGLKHALAVGGYVMLDLTFEHAGHVRAKASVLPIGSAGPDGAP